MKFVRKSPGVWRMTAVVAAVCVLCPLGFTQQNTGPLPNVRLNADSIGPRSIEELTGRNITRDYARAMRDFESALANNDASVLGDYFTGFAKTKLSQRIFEQKSSNIRVLYTDRGHDVRAVFYSVDGGEMQLVDRANLELQIFDGNNLIHQEKVVQNYLVLMTPGADRWFVRSLDPIPEGQP